MSPAAGRFTTSRVLANARGIDFERLAVGLIRQHVLRLDRDEDRQALASTAARVRPRLLVRSSSTPSSAFTAATYRISTGVS